MNGEAVNKALAHTGLDISSVALTKCEKDMEWGTVVYEIEFNRGFFEPVLRIQAAFTTAWKHCNP